MRKLLDFCRDQAGSMAIETAVVAPVLILLSLGIFEASSIVSRQHELQTTAAEGEIIAMATAGGATTTTTTIKSIIQNSVGLSANQISISRLYRCDDDQNTVANRTSCDEDAVVTSYIHLDLTDTYTPLWTEFGLGKPVTFNVERTVQVT